MTNMMKWIEDGMPRTWESRAKKKALVRFRNGFLKKAKECKREGRLEESKRWRKVAASWGDKANAVVL